MPKSRKHQIPPPRIQLEHIKPDDIPKMESVIDYPSYVIDKGFIKDKITCEVNIAMLDKPLKPKEEAIITITPKADKPIKQIVSSYVMMDIKNINYDLIFTMIGFTKGEKSFKIYFKNDSDREHILKIYYHVLF
jgi:hypothetical protein